MEHSMERKPEDPGAHMTSQEEEHSLCTLLRLYSHGLKPWDLPQANSKLELPILVGV